MITTTQIKAARALLNIKQSDLAKKSGVSIATLNNIERGAQADPRVSTITSIQAALEKSGITFINDSFEGVGVCLKPQAAHADSAVILIIDDNKADRTLYRSWLSKMPNKKCRIYEADSARSGFDAFIEHQPQCIILDFMMFGADGFQLLAALKRDHTKLPPIIFVSAMHSDVLSETAKSHNVFCCLDKKKLTQQILITSIKSALN